jgi:protein O-mannosyl-transferase
LFGVHPAHVESVAWIAERKDVLYSLFYLFSLVVYIGYIDKNKKWLLNVSLALFFLSLLSKPMAVTLPAVFFLIDYFKSRKIGKQGVIEKLPFLILSGIFVFIALNSHYASSDSHTALELSLAGSTMRAANGTAFYIVKILWPAKLSYYYPYWQETWKDFFVYQPAVYAAEVLLAGLILFSLKFGKTVLFGALFFIITLLPALQLLPFGLKIPADRYLYVPSIGIIFIAAAALAWLFNKQWRHAKPAFAVILLLIVGTLCFLCYLRCGAWRNSYTLYTDAIEKYPKLANPYKDRADVYKDEDKPDAALAEYSKALELKPDFAQVFNNRANLYMGQKKYAQAIEDYTAAIKINPVYIAAIYNRAIAYGEIKAFDKALADYTQAIAKRPGYYEAFNNRGILYAKMGMKNEALNDFTKAISINPDFSDAYNNRAFAYFLSGDNVRCAGDVRVLLERKYSVNPGMLKYLKDKKLIQ